MGISLKNYLYKKAAFGEQACFFRLNPKSKDASLPKTLT